MGKYGLSQGSAWSAMARIWTYFIGSKVIEIRMSKGILRILSVEELSLIDKQK
jgi:hypothetical protein